MNYVLIFLLCATPHIDAARNTLLRVAGHLSPRKSVVTSYNLEYDAQIDLSEWFGSARVMTELSFSMDLSSSSMPSSVSFVPSASTVPSAALLPSTTLVPSSSPIPSSIPSNVVSDSPSYIKVVADSSEGSRNGSMSTTWMIGASFFIVVVSGAILLAIATIIARSIRRTKNRLAKSTTVSGTNDESLGSERGLD